MPEPTLFDKPQTEADRKFWEFHLANPHVYAMFREKAWQAKRAGQPKSSARLIFESIRWDFHVSTTETEPALNNNYFPKYARLLVEREPAFEGFSEFRERGRGAA